MLDWKKVIRPPHVFPLDARVDPANFPESDYPIHCVQCDYLLTGLSEERCPECGTPFERGRRIVDEHYRGIVCTQRVRMLTVRVILGALPGFLLGSGLTIWYLFRSAPNPSIGILKLLLFSYIAAGGLGMWFASGHQTQILIMKRKRAIRAYLKHKYPQEPAR